MNHQGVFYEEDYAVDEWVMSHPFRHRRRGMHHDEPVPGGMLYATPRPITRQEFMQMHGDEISNVYNAIREYMYNTGVTMLARMTLEDFTEFVWRLNTVRRVR